MNHVIESNGHMADAEARVLDARGNEFTPASLAELDKSGIPPDKAAGYGVLAVRHPDHVPQDIARYWVKGAGMLFEWRDLDRTVVQFRPDEPVKDDEGKTHKYALPKGCGTFLGHLRQADDGSPVLFVEGTKQGLSAAVWAPAGWGVVSVPGCQNWAGTDLTWAEDRKVVCLFDADIAANRDVYEAASGLKDALEAEGAASVVFAKLAGARAKEGLDDVLGRRAEDKRTPYLQRICEGAKKALGRPPARKKNGPGAALFSEKGSLLAQSATNAVLEDQPAALALGSMVALYRDGRYVIDRGKEQLFATVQEKLGEEYRPQWRATIEEVLIGRLAGDGTRLPERMPDPLLNCKNGMLDLRTGELLPHDPSYLSSRQIPLSWNPDATCAAYLDWAASVVPDQLEDLEESVSLMLDPSRTPGKAVFLFGPSHSGKSTYLRIMERACGHENVSAVTLHQLGDDKFAAANIYQRMLNVAADLSSKHVTDLSVFKMLSGEDPIHANRKYGKEFTFTNQALFAFSANELPTVSEASRAYANRMKPFEFPYSFSGREDPTIEEAVMKEMEGILVRWVSAWQRHRGRGGYLPTDQRVMREFETRSDRVALWVSEKCLVHPEAAGKLVGPDQGTKMMTLHHNFKDWARDEDSSSSMSSRKFLERLRSVTGVGEVRLRHEYKNVGLNVTPRPAGVGNTTTVCSQSTTDDKTDATDKDPFEGGTVTQNGVGGVPGVGSDPSSPNVRELKDNDHGRREVSHRRMGEDVFLPTPGTPPTPSVRGAASVTVSDVCPGPVGFDLETHGAGELFTHPRGEFVRLVGAGPEGNVTVTPETALCGPLTASGTLVGHNHVLFDLIAADRHLGIPVEDTVPRSHDVRFAAFQHDPPSSAETNPGPGFKSYSLDALAHRYLNGAKSPDGKTLAKEFGGWGNIPVDDPRYNEYCRDDVQLALRLAEAIPQTEYDKREMRVAAITARATLEGFRVDVPALTARVAELQAQSESGRKLLSDKYGFPLVNGQGKPAKAPQRTSAGKAAFESALTSLGVVTRDWPRGKDGTLSLAKEVMAQALEWAVRENHPSAQVIRAVSEMNGLRNNAANLLRCVAGDRVHPRFEPFQASGRWSVKEPGLSVLAKGGEDSERQFLLPEDGHVLVSFDADQVDIRCVAAHSQDPNLIAIVNDPGRDIHSEVATLAFGDAQGDHRHHAKSCDLGWLYGRSVNGLANTPGIQREAAERVDASMRDQFERVMVWQSEVRRHAESGQLLDNGFGRRLRCEPGREYTQAPALMGQSATRDIVAEGLLRMKDRYPELIPMLRVIVHDEIVMSIPEDRVEEISAMVLEVMAMQFKGVSITWGSSPAGRTWLDCYRKEG
jgi:putative DNA primase/helicase